MSKFTGRINRLQRASARVLSKFTATQRKLEKHNEKLSAEISTLTDELLVIEELRQAAIKQRTQNTGIAERISKLISG
ncbi:hypothetical protein [Paenibacillus planticolens]|uniref:Small acid-soluble spore protein (Thioredoxin-like protein) n=1 Tax=Paenibacillus planticolens TaxID=2654976 RepID=A0ABX1ZIF7_9BACL|nr:hypothetical protein [Paenibacillus planticolens]NOU98439.1 hypothetical protein [Paenibacillus planticolens]